MIQLLKKKRFTRALTCAAILLITGFIIYLVWPEKRLPPSVRVDKILVIKHQRKMMLLKEGRVLKTYHVSLGRVPVGRKTHRDDRKTPEGYYTIDWRNPKSKYHLSLHISYPNQMDSRNASLKGQDPGGNIMIHGVPNGLGPIGKSFRFRDWTNGCIAVTDSEMDEIWQSVPTGTPIEIQP